MVRLQVLTGTRAGVVAEARWFPWRIGRRPDADLRLEDDGVWDHHLDLDLEVPDGIRLSVVPPALATVNDEPVQHVVLRNGDRIGLGPVRLQFWLSEPRQSSLRLREWGTWFLLAVLTVAEVSLVYVLQR